MKPLARVWSMRRDGAGRMLIIAVHASVFAAVPVYAAFGTPVFPLAGAPTVVLPLGFAMFVLQLRHSLAARREERPLLWPLTLLALVVLAYAPLPWFGWEWALMTLYVTPSLSMLLPRGLAVVGIVAVIAGYDVAVLLWYRGPAVYEAVYILVAACLIWMTLYGSARLVRLLDELRAAQAELAELAIGSERLRVSRDLHDLLGQSLSAVSLKGSLAIRLLGHDVVAARAEIESLTGVARDALRGIRAVTRDQHPMSLGAEVAGAAALMAAAGIRHHIDVDLPGLAPPLERALAWTVREGVANVLQHSKATTCSIVAGRQGGTIHLEMVNDGATTSAAGGSGLAGAAERARALSGRASAGPMGDGRFRLLIELPEATM